MLLSETFVLQKRQRNSSHFQTLADCFILDQRNQFDGFLLGLLSASPILLKEEEKSVEKLTLFSLVFVVVLLLLQRDLAAAASSQGLSLASFL